MLSNLLQIWHLLCIIQNWITELCHNCPCERAIIAENGCWHNRRRVQVLKFAEKREKPEVSVRKILWNSAENVIVFVDIFAKKRTLTAKWKFRICAPIVHNNTIGVIIYTFENPRGFLYSYITWSGNRRITWREREKCWKGTGKNVK